MKKLYLLLFIFLTGFCLPQEVRGDILYDTLTGANLNSAGRGMGTTTGEYFFRGTNFMATSTMYDVGSITVSLQKSTFYTYYEAEDFMLYVLEGSTTTPRDNLKLVGVSMYSTITTAKENIKFDFFQPITLVDQVPYLFEVRPLNYQLDSYDYLLYGSTQLLDPLRHSYSWHNEDGYGNYDTRAVPVKIETWYNTSQNEMITMTVPCFTSNLSDVPCTFGYASTSLLTVEGVSTNYRSWESGNYNVDIALLDSNNYVISWRALPAPSLNEPFNYTTTLEWDNPTSALAKVRVCQTESWGGGFVGSNTDCAFAVIGYDLSTASTTELAQATGLLAPRPLDGYVPQEGGKTSLWLTNGCDSIGITEPFKAIKCALIWAFEPSDSSINSFHTAKDSVLTVYPIGYATLILSDVRSAFTSTSTASLDKDIDVKKFFGQSGGTTTISVANLTSELGLVEPIIKYFETIAWLLFTAWLLYWGLTRKL
jgi:hypothetical protein